MDEEDRDDIIKKINTSGADDSEESDLGGDNSDSNDGDDNNDGIESDDNMSFDSNDEEDLEEIRLLETTSEIDNNTTLYPEGWKELDGIMFGIGKKCSMFAPEGSPEFMEQNRIPESFINKNFLKQKILETFINDQPTIEPIVKPKIDKPTPKRRNKPFTIEPDSIPQPAPKAIK